MERKLSPRSANSPTEAAACRLLLLQPMPAPQPAARLEAEDGPHDDEQWSVPTYLRREGGSMPRPSSWTVMMEEDDVGCDDDGELIPAVPAPPAPPPPTTTVTVAADADAAFLTSSSTARPALPMTVPARTAPEAADERGRTRPPLALALRLLGLLLVVVLMMVTVVGSITVTSTIRYYCLNAENCDVCCNVERRVSGSKTLAS